MKVSCNSMRVVVEGLLRIREAVHVVLWFDGARSPNAWLRKVVVLWHRRWCLHPSRRFRLFGRLFSCVRSLENQTLREPAVLRHWRRRNLPQNRIRFFNEWTAVGGPPALEIGAEIHCRCVTAGPWLHGARQRVGVLPAFHNREPCRRPPTDTNGIRAWGRYGTGTWTTIQAEGWAAATAANLPFGWLRCSAAAQVACIPKS